MTSSIVPEVCNRLYKNGLKFLLLPIVLWPVVATASGSSGVGTISYFYQRSSDGLLGIYREGGDWGNPDGCQSSTQIVLTRSNASRSEFYAAILAAKMSGSPIQAHLSGCVDWNGITYPSISGLFVR